MSLCGHCGTRVNDGFIVCTGCGARLERKYKSLFLTLFLLFPIPIICIVIMIDGIEQEKVGLTDYITFLLVFTVSSYATVLAFRKSITKKWVLRYPRR